MQRNTPGQVIAVFAFTLANNQPKLNDEGNITAEIAQLPGGSLAPTDDVNPTPIGGGYYYFNPTAPETDGSSILFVPTSATPGVQVMLAPLIDTVPPNFSVSQIDSDGAQWADVRKVTGDDALAELLGIVLTHSDIISTTTAYSLGGSTASDVFLEEAYDAANEDRYVGNLLVWNGQARLITTYGNSGSGGDIVVSEPFTDAPAAGDTLAIVLNRDVGPSGGGGSGTGPGNTPVDHDGGTDVTVDGQPSEADVMRYVDGVGAGVPELFIRAYLASDYDADPPIRVALGTTTTGSDGRWVAPLMLDAGTYKVVADRTGDGFLPQVNEIVVP